jgi:hypothetical protein
LVIPLLVLSVASCTFGGEAGSTTTSAGLGESTVTGASTVPDGSSRGDPPPTLDAAPSPQVEAAVERLLADVYTTEWDITAIADLADLGDVRTAWILADLMRFYQAGAADEELVAAFTRLTGAQYDPGEVSFVWAMNNLIAWDLPAWDGYPAAKSALYTPVEALWQRFFEQNVGLDWRLVTWGGVLADDRPLDDDSPCNCIPALDHPETTDPAGGDWYGDDRTVFGVVVDDEAIALPKHQMEVHEMVNLTLGGRELGIPYCTLCASAQAYYADDVAGVDRVVLRTSGLLKRANKLMYDLTTGSVIDTFTGQALTGSLAQDGVTLEQVSVVASTLCDWKRAHPNTRVLAQDGGIGRSYRDDPLAGRDDDGPIFPIGRVDSRLPIQERVVGVISPDGTPVALPITGISAALADGPVEYRGLTVHMEESIRVYDSEGEEVVSHEAFWFAWSQFHPTTVVWGPVGS